MRTVLALSGLLATATPALAQAPQGCPVRPDIITANAGLQNARAAVATGRLTILAMGSSSIEGVGASQPDLGFVPLLEAALERRLPGVAVTVLNKGIGGETARDTRLRFDREISAAQPDLVIWQLGTNDVLRDRDMDDIFADFRQGQAVLDEVGVDVLLIDPQRLPETTANPAFKGRNPALAEMARLIDLEGNRVGYAVQHRFRAMADWAVLPGGGVGPDDLHLNDAGYACWAENTAEGLAAALL